MTTACWTAFSLNILFTGRMFNQVPQPNKSTNGTWGNLGFIKGKRGWQVS